MLRNGQSHSAHNKIYSRRHALGSVNHYNPHPHMPGLGSAGLIWTSALSLEKNFN